MSPKNSVSEPEDNKDLKFWRAFHAELQAARDSLPYAHEPDEIDWDPVEHRINDLEQLQVIEDECRTETDALIRHYCTNHIWPNRSKNDIRYLAGRRILWALRFVRIFTIPLSETGKAAVPRPPQSGWDLLNWLLVDAYHQRFPPSRGIPMYPLKLD